jgi:Na+-translocating ferredoxin:NAD+ oxidoreductase RnfC subunit
MILYDPCELNLDDHEPQQLAAFLHGYLVTDESIELALEVCFKAGECELTCGTRAAMVNRRHAVRRDRHVQSTFARDTSRRQCCNRL